MSEYAVSCKPSRMDIWAARKMLNQRAFCILGLWAYVSWDEDVPGAFFLALPPASSLVSVRACPWTPRSPSPWYRGRHYLLIERCSATSINLIKSSVTRSIYRSKF